MPQENRGSRHAQEGPATQVLPTGRPARLAPVWVLARLSLTDLTRSRLRFAVLLALPCLLLLADFAATLALTDATAIRLVLFGASARLLLAAMVASVAFFTLAEDQRSGLAEFFITRGTARSSFYLGRALGVGGIAGIFALLAGILAALGGGQVTPVLQWTFGMWLELVLVGWLAQMAAITLREPALGFLFVGGAYVLARISPALLAMAQGLLPESPTVAQQLLLTGVVWLDRLLPDLSTFADGEVLLGEGAGVAQHLAGCLSETALFGALLLAVGLIDFQRLVTGRPLHGRLR